DPELLCFLCSSVFQRFCFLNPGDLWRFLQLWRSLALSAIMPIHTPSFDLCHQCSSVVRFWFAGLAGSARSFGFGLPPSNTLTRSNISIKVVPGRLYALKDREMAEKMHRSSDVPDFDSYPGSPPINESDKLLQKGHSSLEQHAAELGAAAGKLVFMVKQAGAKVEGLPRHAALDRLSKLGEETRARAGRLGVGREERAHNWTEAAGEKTADLPRLAREQTQELGRRVKTGLAQAKGRARHIGREYPLHVALSAGAVGFLLG